MTRASPQRHCEWPRSRRAWHARQVRHRGPVPAESNPARTLPACDSDSYESGAGDLPEGHHARHEGLAAASSGPAGRMGRGDGLPTQIDYFGHLELDLIRDDVKKSKSITIKIRCRIIIVGPGPGPVNDEEALVGKVE